MRRVAAGAALALAALALAPTAGAHPSWQSYVESPTSRSLVPVRVVRVTGDVRGAAALTSGGAATLTYRLGGPAPVIVFDYGREIGGIATFDVIGASGVPLLQAAYSETLANLGPSGDQAATPLLFLSGNALRADTFAALSPGTLTSSVLQGGERYELVTLATPGSVTLRRVGIHYTGFLGAPDALRGHFHSSDPLLNRIFYAGVWTLNLNQDVPGTSALSGELNGAHLLLDGAKRDRAVWSGDQLIAGLTALYTVDPAYERDSLQLIADHPGTLGSLLAPSVGLQSAPGPEPGVCSPNTVGGDGCVFYSLSYSLVFVPAVYQYYLYTGDLGFVRRVWPAVVRGLAWAAGQRGGDGLLQSNALDGFDWNVSDPVGTLTYDNAVYVKALSDAARLAGALGSAGEAADYESTARAVAGEVNAELWDPRTGVYDGSTTDRGTVIQDANVEAVLSGIATPDRGRELLAVLARALETKYGPRDVSLPAPTGYSPIVTPYIGSFQVQAEFRTGLTSLALAMVRTEWGWMVTHDPQGVDWEKIEPNGVLKGLDSAAHAWSTGPTASLSQFVLGVSPVSPGFAMWSVAPQLGDLAWAQGTVPTPRGPIAVSWVRGRRSFRLSVGAPFGTAGTVVVPLLGGGRTIRRDGRVVWSHGRPAPGVSAYVLGDAVVFTGQSGAHVFTWRAGAA